MLTCTHRYHPPSSLVAHLAHVWVPATGSVLYRWDQNHGDCLRKARVRAPRNTEHWMESVETDRGQQLREGTDHSSSVVIPLSFAHTRAEVQWHHCTLGTLLRAVCPPPLILTTFLVGESSSQAGGVLSHLPSCQSSTKLNTHTMQFQCVTICNHLRNHRLRQTSPRLSLPPVLCPFHG